MLTKYDTIVLLFTCNIMLILTLGDFNKNFVIIIFYSTYTSEMHNHPCLDA